MSASKPRRVTTKTARRQSGPYPARARGPFTTATRPPNDTTNYSPYKDSETVSGLGQMLRTPSPRRSPRLARRRAARCGTGASRSLDMHSRSSHVIPTSPVRSLQRIGLPSSFSSSSVSNRPNPVAHYVLSHGKRSGDLGRVPQLPHDRDTVAGWPAKAQHRPDNACTSTGLIPGCIEEEEEEEGNNVGIDGHQQRSLGFGDIAGLDEDPREEVEIASRHVLSPRQSISFLSCYQ